MIQTETTTEVLDYENSPDILIDEEPENLTVGNLDNVISANFFGLSVLTLERSNNKAFLDFDNREWKHYDSEGKIVSETQNLIGTAFEGLHKAITFDLLDKGYSISRYQENGQDKATIYTIDGQGNISFANVLIKEGPAGNITNELAAPDLGIDNHFEANTEDDFEQDLQEVEENQERFENLKIVEGSQIKVSTDNDIAVEPLTINTQISRPTIRQSLAQKDQGKPQASLNGITLIKF